MKIFHSLSVCSVISLCLSTTARAQIDFDDGRTLSGTTCCPSLSGTGQHKDIAIETTVTMPSGGAFVGIIARQTSSGEYWAGMYSTGELAVGYSLPGPDIRTQMQGVNLPGGPFRGENVTMRLDVTDNVLALTAWQTDLEPVQSTTLSWTDPDALFPRGTSYSLFINPRGNEESVEFKSGQVTIAPFEQVPGDYNFDGLADIDDLNSLCSALNRERYSDSFDLNSDEKVDALDLQLHLAIANTTVGDTNLDGEVNFEDFNRLSAAFGTGRSWSEGDFDCDRDVDFSDFLALSSNFGGLGREASIASVPEPDIASSCWCLLIILLGSNLRCRRSFYTTGVLENNSF
jgi:hypothetical protein